jgi:hypothetical protein
MASTPDIEDLLKGQITFQLFNDYGLHINLDDRDLEGNRVYSNRADYLTIRHSYAIPRTDLGSHSFAIFPPN